MGKSASEKANHATKTKDPFILVNALMHIVKMVQSAKVNLFLLHLNWLHLKCINLQQPQTTSTGGITFTEQD